MILKTVVACILSAVFIPLVSSGQEVHRPVAKRNIALEEKISDPYVPNAGRMKQTSPAYRDFRVGSGNTTIFTVQVNTDGENNLLQDAANEPSIAVNPANTNQIAIGWREFDDVNNNFRQAGWNYSTDAGHTWNVLAVIDQGTFRSDPVLDYDLNGNFYYNSLTNFPDYFCKVFASADGGVTWDNGTDAHGGDKQWMAIDRSGGQGTGNIYSAWNLNFSTCMPGDFTRSTDGNASYEDCSAVDGDPFWATMAVGNAGELYIGGAGDLSDSAIVAVSLDAQNSAGTPTWSYHSVFMDGYLNYGLGINPVGLVGQGNIDVDHSFGPGRDNVYLLASVTRLSNSDLADVMFVRSTDGGNTWSAPVKVNDDASTINIQWLATMSVAPNGRIDAVWLDTRDSAGYNVSALYYSYSVDEGVTWSVNEKLSDSFDPSLGYPNQSKMGDYFDMTSDSMGAHLAWANTLNGEEDVYYSYIVPHVPIGIDEIAGRTFRIYPNPAHNTLNVECRVQNAELKMYDMTGRIVLEETLRSPLSAFSFDLCAGIYLVRVQAGDKVWQEKVVIQ